MMGSELTDSIISWFAIIFMLSSVWYAGISEYKRDKPIGALIPSIVGTIFFLIVCILWLGTKLAV
jgi:hypothetical protein